jgi:hypothetical protein
MERHVFDRIDGGVSIPAYHRLKMLLRNEFFRGTERDGDQGVHILYKDLPKPECKPGRDNEPVALPGSGNKPELAPGIILLVEGGEQAV